MVNVKTNDLEILWTQPGESDPNSATTLAPEVDARVPTAQELAANSHLQQQNLAKAQRIDRPSGVLARPSFAVAAGRQITISDLLPYAPGHPALAAIAPITIAIPALADTVSVVSRYDHCYLAVMGVTVTGAIDPDVNLSFDWRSQAGTIQILSKENTRRIRSVWGVLCSQGQTNANAFYNALTDTSGKKTFTSNNSVNGIALGAFRFYPLDPNLANSKIYEVWQDTIELIDLCRVWRSQNFSQNGFVWGRNGESNTFELNFHVQPTYRFVGSGWDNWQGRASETLRRIMLGLPLVGTVGSDRLVSNLLNGQVGANLDAPGIATASPNGSTALSNGQRVSFSNQAITQKTYCLPVTTVNAGGFAQAQVPFQTNSPAGSYFSQNAADHKIYTATGRDVSADGILTGLGGTGALTWTANSNAVAAPGDVVFVVPGIYYPAGSGFANSGTIEQVFRNNTALNTANVREASSNDLTAYAAPANNEQFIAVLGRERAALHYIYRSLTIASNAQGVVAIPTTERGVIAFISGINAPTGRVDRPVITGLNPSTNYQVLVYHPPSATDTWQFQFRVARYAGTGEGSFLNGSQIEISPVAIAHTQGGGNSFFLGDGEFQFDPIAFRLPANTLAGSTKHFACNYKIQYLGESDNGQNSIRWLRQLDAAAGLVLPKEGLILTLDTAGAAAQSKGIAGRLKNFQGRVLGFLKAPILCGQVYQVVIAAIARKDSDRRLLVITSNEGNPLIPSGVAIDSNSPNFAAFDTFPLY